MNRKFKVTYQDKALNKIVTFIRTSTWSHAIIEALSVKKADHKLLTIEWSVGKTRAKYDATTGVTSVDVETLMD